MIQRELNKGNRITEISKYILTTKDRFFNSLVIAVYEGDPAWHEFDIKEKKDQVSRNDLDDTALYSVGYLSLTKEEKLFALDGQHRLAGIKKANRPHKKGAIPAPKTLHNEIVTLRQVLRTAERHGWISFVPNLSAPFRGNGKVSHRPWFSPAEYKSLYEATRENAEKARPQDKWHAEQLHDYVLFMGNTGLRPDEAKNLQHRDVEIVHDKATGQEILVIEVRGKRGIKAPQR